MARLTVGAGGSFVWLGNISEAYQAQDAGFCLSTSTRLGPDECCFFTADHKGEPVFQPFAALPFYEIADDKAKAALNPYWADYAASFATESTSVYPCPATEHYMSYQVAGIDFALRRTGTLFGDEPGLGKTVEALGVVNATDEYPVLIVCPASVRIQWEKMARKWLVKGLKGRPLTIYRIMKSSDGVHPKADVVIISFEGARSPEIQKQLCERDWGVVVIDEAHYLKNHEAARTKAILGSWSSKGREPAIIDKAKRKLFLTGTPLPNRPRECYTLGRALDWEALDFMSYDAFQFRFNPSMQRQVKRKDGTTAVVNDERAGRLPELQARLRANFMIRRAKLDVLKDLPAKRFELTFVEENAAIRKALAAESLLKFNPDDIDTSDFKLLGHIAAVRHQMGIAKVPRVVEHVQMLMEGGEDKLVIFAYHKEVMTMLQEALKRYGIARIDGSVTANGRVKAIEAFVENPKIRIFLGQISATGTGVDGLQKVCSHAVFAEADWTPGVNAQATDRLHRHGQRGSVLAEFLVAPGSLDEKILGSAIRKLQVIDVVMDRHLTAA